MTKKHFLNCLNLLQKNNIFTSYEEFIRSDSDPVRFFIRIRFSDHQFIQVMVKTNKHVSSEESRTAHKDGLFTLWLGPETTYTILETFILKWKSGVKNIQPLIEILTEMSRTNQSKINTPPKQSFVPGGVAVSFDMLYHKRTIPVSILVCATSRDYLYVSKHFPEKIAVFIHKQATPGRIKNAISRIFYHWIENLKNQEHFKAIIE